jgi:hypothetical protein
MNETNAKRTCQIVAQHAMGIEFIEPRGRDHLDFHDLHVATIERGLRQAYRAGYKDGVEGRGQTPSEELMDAIEMLGFLNSKPTEWQERDQQLEQVHRWYTNRLRPALARMKKEAHK